MNDFFKNRFKNKRFNLFFWPQVVAIIFSSSLSVTGFAIGIHENENLIKVNNLILPFSNCFNYFEKVDNLHQNQPNQFYIFYKKYLSRLYPSYSFDVKIFNIGVKKFINWSEHEINSFNYDLSKLKFDQSDKNDDEFQKISSFAKESIDILKSINFSTYASDGKMVLGFICLVMFIIQFFIIAVFLIKFYNFGLDKKKGVK